MTLGRTKSQIFNTYFSDLELDTTYYFAVTAIDSIERESENYSLEISAIIDSPKPIEPILEATEIVEYVEPEEEIEETTEIVELVEPILETTETIEPFQSSAPDTEAPESATNIQIKNGDNQAMVLWTRSNSNDVASQEILYKAASDDQWKSKIISAITSAADIKTEENKNYTLKIVTSDTSGNKSESETSSFATTLSESGPATNLAIILALAFIGFILFTSKRRA